MSTPLEHYAMIGDGETAALLDRDGSIDWLCWPRFDSDACLAALLGDPGHGRWSITPAAPITKRARRYQTDTMVMETDLHTETGAVRLIDFMPRRDGPSSLVRIVTGLHGRVPMRMDLALRFDYGAMPPWTEPAPRGFTARIGPDVVVLHAPVGLAYDGQRAGATFDVHEGERLPFVLRYAEAGQPDPPPIDTEAALYATQQFWRNWIARFDNARTKWPGQVRRSLLTLKALVHQPSGGLIAAPTTSLPEAPGGSMNWDYRFCWLRDAAFTISALVNAGYTDEAGRWRDWLLRAVAGEPGQVRIMYRIDGGRRLNEWQADHLPGWRHARPVRIGNAAATQHQIDVFGEVMHALHLARRAGLPATDHEQATAHTVARHLMRIWNSRGSGIWESRAEPRQYTYSKAVASVGLRNFRDTLPGSGDQQFAADLAAHADVIRAEVLREGWNEGLNRFTAFYGGQSLDASLLLMPLVGFLPATDPRMSATIDAIGRELGEGGLIRRNAPSPAGPNEGAFLACSCWMADCLRQQGRMDQAEAQFERVLALANDVGLLSEEYDVPAKHLSGNFPQALTHLAVVNTALALCGPVLHLGGG